MSLSNTPSDSRSHRARNPRGVIEREDAAICVFLCTEPSTKQMEREAAGAGFYTLPMGTRDLRLHMLTIQGLLDGKKVDMSPWREFTPKQAPKAKRRSRRMRSYFESSEALCPEIRNHGKEEDFEDN